MLNPICPIMLHCLNIRLRHSPIFQCSSNSSDDNDDSSDPGGGLGDGKEEQQWAGVLLPLRGIGDSLDVDGQRPICKAGVGVGEDEGDDGSLGVKVELLSW